MDKLTKREGILLAGLLLAALATGLEYIKAKELNTQPSPKLSSSQTTLPKANQISQILPRRSEAPPLRSQPLTRIEFSATLPGMSVSFVETSGQTASNNRPFQISLSSREVFWERLTLRNGDIFEVINGNSDLSMENLIRLLSAFPDQQENTIQIRRNNKLQTIRYWWEDSLLQSEVSGLESSASSSIAPSPSPDQSSQNVSEISARSAIDQVRILLSEVFSTQEQYPAEEDFVARQNKLFELAGIRFDSEEMARRSAGLYWQQFNSEERQEFIKLFTKVFLTTYLKMLDKIKPDMLTIDSETVDYPRAVIRTTIRNNGATYSIDYKLTYTGNRWSIVDVISGQIGLVANYRNEFSGIIRREGVAGLLERLKRRAS